jgi:hypothetical protein
MTIFLALILVALILSVAFVLIKGLVSMAQTGPADFEGEGPSPRALKSQKLMQQRVLLQGAAILVIALLLALASS